MARDHSYFKPASHSQPTDQSHPPVQKSTADQMIQDVAWDELLGNILDDPPKQGTRGRPITKRSDNAARPAIVPGGRPVEGAPPSRSAAGPHRYNNCAAMPAYHSAAAPIYAAPARNDQVPAQRVPVAPHPVLMAAHQAPQFLPQQALNQQAPFQQQLLQPAVSIQQQQAAPQYIQPQQDFHQQAPVQQQLQQPAAPIPQQQAAIQYAQPQIMQQMAPAHHQFVNPQIPQPAAQQVAPIQQAAPQLAHHQHPALPPNAMQQMANHPGPVLPFPVPVGWQQVSLPENRPSNGLLRSSRAPPFLTQHYSIIQQSRLAAITRVNSYQHREHSLLKLLQKMLTDLMSVQSHLEVKPIPKFVLVHMLHNKNIYC